MKLEGEAALYLSSLIPPHLLLFTYFLALGSLPFTFARRMHDPIIPYEDTRTEMESNFKVSKIVGSALLLWLIFDTIIKGMLGLRHFFIVIFLLFALLNSDIDERRVCKEIRTSEEGGALLSLFFLHTLYSTLLTL